jgi:hypothetical protein
MRWFRDTRTTYNLAERHVLTYISANSRERFKAPHWSQKKAYRVFQHVNTKYYVLRRF